MIVTVLKVVGGIIACFVVLVIVAFAIKGSASTETVKSNTLSVAFLEKNKEPYVTCINSVGGEGKAKVSEVTWSYLPDYSLEKLEVIEQSFMKQVQAGCKEQIEKYEASYEEMKRTEQEIAQANLSMLEEYLGIKAKPDQQKLRAYNPTMVKFFGGESSFNNLTFTEDEVKAYFEERL